MNAYIRRDVIHEVRGFMWWKETARTAPWWRWTISGRTSPAYYAVKW